MNLDFIFVGPQKTGTTWIYENLKVHPDICFPRDVKETMFFDRNFEKGVTWYQWYYSECRENNKTGEVAPTYFDVPEVPERIKHLFPTCKIIISLRDPVERAKSLYHHHYRKGRVGDTFINAIEVKPEIITSGFFAEHIPRWFEYFDESQILVISLKEISSNPEAVLNRVCEFLDIKFQEYQPELMKQRIYQAVNPRNSKLAGLGSKIASKLHSHRLHFLVNLAKKIGLDKFFFKESSEKPTLSARDERLIKEKFAPHIYYVKEKFGENIL